VFALEHEIPILGSKWLIGVLNGDIAVTDVSALKHNLIDKNTKFSIKPTPVIETNAPTCNIE
jgi:hypothetical protein